MNITDTNLYVLADCIAAGNGTVPSRVAPTAVPHLRRCIDAGLLVAGPSRGTWVLSPHGVNEMDTYKARTAQSAPPVSGSDRPR